MRSLFSSLMLMTKFVPLPSTISFSFVQVVNINNGERIETYVIPGKKASGEITLNGPAARRVAKGDIVIIIAYATMDFEEAKRFAPSVIFPNETDNSLT